MDERDRQALGYLGVQVRDLRTAVDALRADIRADRAEARSDAQELGRRIDAVRPTGPVEQGVTTLRRIDRRTLATIVVLVCTLGLGAPAFLWLTGRALHDSPELLSIVGHVWPAPAAGGTTPTTGAMP